MKDFPNMPKLNFLGNRLLRNNYAELFEFIAAKSIKRNQKTTKKVEGSWTQWQKKNSRVCVFWNGFFRKWENKSIVHFQKKKSQNVLSLFLRSHGHHLKILNHKLVM